ncbi:unnamed protein product [Symbiodinium sp. CCMP2592]|nr:unnamed protein product [Symbiodinium sp. CCMP2592]
MASSPVERQELDGVALRELEKLVVASARVERTELEMLMKKRYPKVPRQLVCQLCTIWFAEYNNSLINEVADEPIGEFLERYLYRTQAALKSYPEQSQAYRSKDLEQQFLVKVLEGVFKIELEADEP